MLDTLNGRKNKVSFLTSTTTSEEDEAKSEAFIDEAIENFFPVIQSVTIDSFNNYTPTMRTEEAIVRTEALRHSKLKTSISKNMAEILEKEPSIDPKNIQALIDDRIKVSIKNNSGINKTPRQKNNSSMNKENKKAAMTVSKKAKADADKA